MTRAEFGLPETATVFCCFNQTAKITPPIVELWCRILQAVPGSVLWLRSFYPVADNHLRAAFRARGIDPARLRFAGPMPEPEYLKRYGLCDLFLDTFPFSAHATGSHALFGGCPLLALPGQTFASRVSASLLMALGLPELIASSPQDYVAKAVKIGGDAELRLEPQAAPRRGAEKRAAVRCGALRARHRARVYGDVRSLQRRREAYAHRARLRDWLWSLIRARLEPFAPARLRSPLPWGEVAASKCGG